MLRIHPLRLRPRKLEHRRVEPLDAVQEAPEVGPLGPRGPCWTLPVVPLVLLHAVNAHRLHNCPALQANALVGRRHAHWTCDGLMISPLHRRRFTETDIFIRRTT